MNHIVVYTSPTWPWAHKVKDYLKSKKVDFEEKDLSKDQDAALEMIQKSGQKGVPVIDIDGNILVGYNPAEIDAMLSIQNKL